MTSTATPHIPAGPGAEYRDATRHVRTAREVLAPKEGRTVTADADDPAEPAAPLAGAYVSVVPSTVGHLRLLKIGAVELNLDGMAVRIKGTVVHMAPKEFGLLALLMQNAGRLLTRRQLLDAIWGEGYPDNNKTLEVHIRRLRKHLECDPDAYARMRTVRGVGYVFDLET